jgi:hypothetical protein
MLIALTEYFKSRFVFLLVIGLEMLLATVIVIIRALWNFTIPDFEFMLSIYSELFFFVTFMVLELVICFSFIMLNTERFESELNREMLALNRVFQVCIEEGWIGTNPCRNISMLSEKSTLRDFCISLDPPKSTEEVG